MGKWAVSLTEAIILMGVHRVLGFAPDSLILLFLFDLTTVL